nr:MFS transporter [Allomuricauda sp.]
MYFWLGFCLTAPSIIIQYTFVNSFHLGVVELAEIAGVISVAWALKPFIGWFVDFLSNFISPRFQVSFSYCLSGFALSCINLCPRLWYFVLCLFFSSLFLAFADVVQDSILVRSLRNTSIDKRGSVQSFAWFCRSFGSILGCLLSALFSFHRNRFAIVASIHLGGVCCALNIRIHKNTYREKQLKIREIFCDKEVLLFSLLLFFFAYEPGDSSIFEYQLLKHYKVQPAVLAAAQIIAFGMIMVASALFQRYLRQYNAVGLVTVTSTVCLGVFVARNLFLTKRIDVPVNVFFIGNVAINTFFGHLSFLPLAVISTTLCKPGVEATMYAYFMALTNFSSIISRELSGILASGIGIKKQLQVSNEKYDWFYGICIVLDIIGIIVVFLLLVSLPIRTKEKREIELTEFDHELDEEDFNTIAEDKNDSDLVDIDLN